MAEHGHFLFFSAAHCCKWVGVDHAMIFVCSEICIVQSWDSEPIVYSCCGVPCTSWFRLHVLTCCL